MSYRYDEFSPGEIFHVYTRGVESRDIFMDDRDRERFMKTMLHCLTKDKTGSFSYTVRSKQEFSLTAAGEGLVDILCYCLMSNHLHLLVLENFEDGITRYMQKLLNSYAKYFNTSHERTGSLFDNPFKARIINGDDQLLHVSRYVHINPYVAHMIADPFGYKWSSLREYAGKAEKRTCHTGIIRSLLNREEYKKFVTDEADYARTAADEKYAFIDYSE